MINKKRKSLIYGVGTNDADYRVKVDGIICKYYTAWRHIIERCYSPLWLNKYPTYRNCYVCDDWLLFSNFKLWMAKQDWYGRDLDKDIIKPGNNIYSPENCCFIDQSINKLLTNRGAKRGVYPQGVDLYISGDRFRAQIVMFSKKVFLGVFDTVEQAKSVYNKAKSDHINSIASKIQDQRVRNGLTLHAKLILNEE